MKKMTITARHNRIATLTTEDGTSAYYFHIHWVYQLLQCRGHPLSFTSSCLWTVWIHTGEFELKLFYFWAATQRRHISCLTKPARPKDATNTGRLPGWMDWLVGVFCMSSSTHSVLLHIIRHHHVSEHHLFILVALVMQRSSVQSPYKLRQRIIPVWWSLTSVQMWANETPTLT